jgi:hypothetical protein
MNRLLPEIKIRNRVAPALTARMRYLIAAKRIRLLTRSEQYELSRLHDLAMLGQAGGDHGH